MEESNAAGRALEPALEPGDREWMVDGGFEGHEALIDANLVGEDRVQVLLTYLSQQLKRLIIEFHQIIKKERDMPRHTLAW